MLLILLDNHIYINHNNNNNDSKIIKFPIIILYFSSFYISINCDELINLNMS